MLVASFDLFNSSERLELSIPIADILDLVLPFISEDESDGNYSRNIFTPIEQARASAGLHFSDISQVYLVGGGAKFRPVYLELKRSFLGNLSQALDATYAVSEGAARFAAAAHSGWQVSETTSERIYLRRNRAPFLEILPDKLPIPSERKEPPRPLTGNDTIEMQEESRYLHLEFFQGSQVNDPQMSPVYTATLSFPQPLKQGTEMRSLVGYIDKHKIYHFEIGLTEPDDGRKIIKMVEFSADSEAQPALNSGPQYQLNDNDSLAMMLQGEPMRTQLNTRVGTSPVSFLPPTASAPAQLAEPMESLFEERNAILRAMNESWADAYIGDKFLPTRLRQTLAALENLIIIAGEAADQAAPHWDLVKLYELYDVTLIRSLLDHSFLLYGTTELEQKLGPVVDILRTDLTKNPDRVKILLADLNQHADSSFDVSRDLVAIFLEATANIQGIYDTILNNAEFGVPFKFTAAQRLGNEQDFPARLLEILKQLGNGLRRDEFDAKARPIIATLAETGPHGFEAALGAFNRKELGNAGNLVLGSFGKEFGEWALQHEQLPARYVPVLFIALFCIRGRTLLNKLVFRLLDEWCNESEVARKVNEKRQWLRNPKIYNRLWSETLNLVDHLDGGAPYLDINLIQKVEEAAIKQDQSYMLSLHRYKQLGSAIAEVLMNSVDDSAAAFLIEHSTSGNEHFRRQLVEKLLRRHSFKKLSASCQRLVLQWPVTEQMASIKMLKGILEDCKPELRVLVYRMISQKY